jgi:hypothetical protein
VRLNSFIRVSLGITAVAAVAVVWIAVADRHWAAAALLAVLAVTCAYPAVTGRDPFDTRHRRRKRHRHRSRASTNRPTSE